MSTDVAALPRVHGGLAVPVLRTELLALAADTVAQWAVQATFGAQVVVDVIADVSGKKTPQALHVTPGMHQQRSTAHLLGANLWQSGARVCEAHGGHVPLEDKPRMVAALGCLLHFVDGADPVWYGRKMTLEMTGLTGAVSRQYAAAETRRHGVFCREWIPYMALKALRLHTPEGPLVNPSTHFRALCAEGLMVKDVVHWTWTSRHRLQVTALTEHLTFGVRRQLGQLVRLLMLNFPMLLHQGNHDGSVRYTVDAIDHDPIRRVVTVDRRLCTEVEYDDPSQDGTPMRTHEDLRRAMVTAVGTTSSVDVHPHPRLARMACLWAGPRRWRFTRAHFKRKISSGSRRKGTTKRDQAQRKWDKLSMEAAHGLELLQWRQIRRVVGLTPWGEQLLLRVKHHALSVYDPTSAGLHCPHATCVREGTVSLYHVFWTCPAATQLRKLLVDRWKAAGLRLASYERAIFSLSLAGIPKDITAETGRIIADCLDATIGEIGSAVERITQQCWSLGAAQYLHSAWRWRVAHFDPHNDTSRQYHEARFAARLRIGHADIAQGYSAGGTNTLMVKVGRVICAILGSKWTGSPDTPVATPNTQLLFYAGKCDPATGAGYSGVMVAHVNTVLRRCQVLYLSGTRYEGHKNAGARPLHLGLLKGLRACRQHGWRHVHIVGDNALVSSQHRDRKPPRATALRTAYWTARRTADVVGVQGWHTQPRDWNRTAHAALGVARETDNGLDWTRGEDHHQMSKWAMIMAKAEADVLHWIDTQHELATIGANNSTV